MKPKMYPNYYDVALIPPEDFQDEVIALSRMLYKYGARWKLGKRAYVPHVTLFHVPVRKTDMDEFLHTVSDIASECAEQTLRCTAPILGIADLKSWVSLPLYKNRWLTALHSTVLRRTVRYFDYNHLKIKERVRKTWSLPLRTQQEERQQMIQTYGSPMVGRFWNPHVTLGIFLDVDQAQRAYSHLPKRRSSFRANRIAVYELGENHTCQRKIAEFPFGG
ncbi:MAG: hypothetical protein HYV34_00500 [Candidatus Kerfeldbacteria bacterium]|nr:hypothetical protein [Candidatus Kerfeldbacteria bacterium]